MFRRLLTLVLSAAGMLGGCGGCKFLGYVLAPEPMTKTVKAEFGELAGRRVAVVVYTDESIDYEYAGVRLELSLVLADELRKKVAKVDVVDPRRVANYQDTNVHWDSMDKIQLGNHFGARYVLFVSLVEFSTREPGSTNLYRGRIAAEASVYDTSRPERQARVWNCSNLRVLFPPHAATGQLLDSDYRIRYQTERRLAEMLVRKFYKHKVPRT